MTDEIRELRVRWQNHRQALLRADYNHADEELARTLHFAENTPIIAGILRRLRSIPLYHEFDSEEWLSGRGFAGAMGAGRTNIGFSLDDTERAVQCLKVLELAVRRFTESQDALWVIGQTTYGGRSTKIIDYVRSAIETVFEPFYHHIDAELRAQESPITPAVEAPRSREKTMRSSYSLHLFVATPRDVAAERDRLALIARDLNNAFAAHGLILKLLDWRDVVPDLGRPEDVILDQLPVEKWDIFVGVLWARFGTPPGREDPETGKSFLSGTEEEFTLAYRSWQETGKPRILFYRCKRSIPPDGLDSEQFSLVQKFFDGFKPDREHPGLPQEYGTVDDFERRVRQDLLKLLLEYSQDKKQATLESEVGEVVRALEDEATMGFPDAFRAYDLNDRQVRALAYAFRYGSFNRSKYREVNNVDSDTAQKEIAAMEKLGIVQRKGRKRESHYVVMAPEPVREKMLRQFCRDHDSISNREYRELRNVSRSMAWKELSQLVEEGKLKRVATGRWTHYLPTAGLWGEH